MGVKDKLKGMTGDDFIAAVLATAGPSKRRIECTVRGVPIIFEVDCDSQSIQRIQEQAAVTAEKLAVKRPGVLSELTPVDRKLGALAYFVSECSVEPKLSLANALALARNTTDFLELVELLDAQTRAQVTVTEAKAIESAKKESPKMSDGETI